MYKFMQDRLVTTATHIHKHLMGFAGIFPDQSESQKELKRSLLIDRVSAGFGSETQ